MVAGSVNEEVNELRSGDELLLSECWLKKISSIRINEVTVGLQPTCAGSTAEACWERLVSWPVYLDCRLWTISTPLHIMLARV